MRPGALFIVPQWKAVDSDNWKHPAWMLRRDAPLGVMSIMTYLHARGYGAKLLDCSELIGVNRTNNVLPAILEVTRSLRPSFVGISTVSATFYEAAEIAERIKEKHPEIPVIAGGVHPSVEPLLTLQQIPELDAVCVGPGEEVCLEVLEGAPLHTIPGLMVRGYENEFRKRPLERDLDKYPFPDYELVNQSYYCHVGAGESMFGWFTRPIWAVTSRSCPHSCRYCASDWSKPFRYHSAEYVVEMVKRLARYDVDSVMFLDDHVDFDEDRIVGICEGFIATGLFYPKGRLRWRACTRADRVRPDLLKLMKASGCFHLAFGLESGSDRMLGMLNKKTTVEINRRACTLIREAGLDLMVSFMIGLPGETEADVRATLDFVRSLDCNTIFCCGFTPMPGSPFYREFVAAGILDRNTVNWSEIGTVGISPNHVYCDIETPRLLELYHEALHLARGASLLLVHRDVADRFRPLVRKVRAYSDVVVVRSDRDIGRVPLAERLLNWAARAYPRYRRLFQIVRNNPKKLLKVPGKLMDMLRRRLRGPLQAIGGKDR